MDKSMLAAFADATVSTFKDMFGLDAVPKGPRELPPSESHGWDVTGLVGLAGQAHGIVAIRLTQSLVSSLLEKSGVASESAEEGRKLESGFVGEITNIVAGAAITAMRGIDIEIAPPVIVRGPDHRIGWPGIAPVVALSFGLPAGEFEIDLCIKD
jgi:chemotaxis protein CheX